MLRCVLNLIYLDIHFFVHNVYFQSFLSGISGLCAAGKNCSVTVNFNLPNQNPDRGSVNKRGLSWIIFS